jgi:hypothetical protein
MMGPFQPLRGWLISNVAPLQFPLYPLHTLKNHILHRHPLSGAGGLVNRRDDFQVAPAHFATNF